MRFQTKLKGCCSAWRMIALTVAAMLSALSTAACAAEAVGPAYAIKKYHIHYDVNADGTYIEQHDSAMLVLNERAVQAAQSMEVGMPNGPVAVLAAVDRDVEVGISYTLKKNGARIASTLVNPPPATGMPLRAAPVTGWVPMQMKNVAFQQVEIGDTLVLSYRVIQKKPIFPNNVVFDHIFPQDIVYDDAVISLSAPASMSVQEETSGIGKGEHATDGKIQKWKWKYHNRTTVIQPPGLPKTMARLHISTFADIEVERETTREAMMEAMGGLEMRSQQPVQEIQRCQVLPRSPNDGPEAMDMFKAQVADLFMHAAIVLQREVNDWNTPECVLDDGRQRISALRWGYDLAFRNEPDWSKSLARITYLKSRFPDQAFVALAEASYWRNYAWHARGGGYAPSVTDDGWKLFHERLEKAERVLIDTKPYAADLPAWYAEMIVVQSALGRPEDERDKVFLEGVKRYPAYYTLYAEMLNYLSPKWGGTWRTVDNLINWSVKHTKAVEGNSMYARLYWAATDSGVDLFKDTFASWQKMRRGFEDLAVRHPKSKWNLNNFARFACIAGDKQTFLKLRAQMGNNVIDAAWPENTSLDLCETKFGYAE